MDTKYTVYKTTNLISGKTYIGMHKTSNPNDSYLGSGFQIKQAIKKYGRENFKKEILAVFETDSEARELEKQLVDASWITEESNYNLAPGGGGHGGRQSPEARKRLADWNRKTKKGNQYHKGFKHTQEAKDAVSKANSGRVQNLTDEQRSERRRRRIEFNKSDFMRERNSIAHRGNRYRLGHKNSPEHNAAISRANSGLTRTDDVKRRISETLKSKPTTKLYTDGFVRKRFVPGQEPAGFEPVKKKP